MYPDFFEHTLVQAGFQKRTPLEALSGDIYEYKLQKAGRRYYVRRTDLKPDNGPYLRAIEVTITIPHYGNFLIHTPDLQQGTARSLLYDTSWSEQELDVLQPFGLTVICDPRHSDELQRRLQQPEVQQTVGELAQAGESFYLFSASSSSIILCVAMRRALPERLRVWLRTADQFADALMTSDYLAPPSATVEQVNQFRLMIMLSFIAMLLLPCIVILLLLR